ncbi:carbohydrate ABC transporter permease [Cohnella zeiphila]|uniref:Carbohydrate ABC transporter permease n=1 Tax=Cohnella zeiphila TaxID=2761120 RepID=A0A7X0VUY6_9BACL|nr:carbohydrate ABC transporter permease [Cohnella zeiphila]MBB6730807.1 carbohydrate ABC transporter permease [Cohnella zeiphila]
MPRRKSPSAVLFAGFNYTFLIGMALLCLAPLVHVLAVSFSASSAVTAGRVTFWPVRFTLESYRFVAEKPAFIHSVLISVERAFIGTLVNMLLTILIAFPLSKESQAFSRRNFYTWIFVFSMLFSGGLIPWYMVIKGMGLLDSLWALILPGAVPVFNVILLLNFFRGLPKELEESAFMDGAGYWRTLWRIYVPLSTPSLATLTLFALVGHWNSWFDGIILMGTPDHYPLSSYLQTMVVQMDIKSMIGSDLAALQQISDQTAKAAQIFLGALPILLVYPFLQRYFISGMTLGSVKE